MDAITAGDAQQPVEDYEHALADSSPGAEARWLIGGTIAGCLIVIAAVLTFLALR